MASTLPTFEYDIFISYRHNDNRSGWVTDFVNALQEELAATIKEPLSIYFDKNPHDGLLETHNVDKSLEGKLKCLIFIPIISQTYCDTKSFAWQHEFVAFNKLAQGDQFGRDIKLSNGNVASRILPIKIHDLDPDDKTAIENEIGGGLRAIEFIFKAPGVNRPLRSIEERPNDNINKTFYRDQINKVANAIKESVIALTKPQITPKERKLFTSEKMPSRSNSWRWIIFGALILVGGLISVFLILNNESKPSARSRILVLPFDIADSSSTYFARGITVDLVTEMGKIRGFSTLGWNTSFQYAGTKKQYLEIAQETNATHILSATIQRDGSRIRINAALVDPFTSETLETWRWDEEASKIFDIQKQIAMQVSKELNWQLTPADEQSLSNRYRTNSIEAYELLLKARAEIRKLYNNPAPIYATTRYLNEALTLDPNYPDALILKAYTRVELAAYGGIDPTVEYREGKLEIEKALRFYPNSSDAYMVSGLLNFFFSWNITKAKSDFEESWRLSNYGETSIYQCNCGYVGYQIATGAFIDALKTITKVEELDPSYPYGFNERLIIYRVLEKKDEMKSAFESIDVNRTRPFEPTYFYEIGKFKESIDAFKREREQFVWPSTYLANAYYKAGFREKSDSIVQSMIIRSKSERNLDFGLAVIFAARGDRENALKWYKSAFDKHDFWIPYTRGDADLRLIINEAEVQQILKSIGL